MKKSFTFPLAVVAISLPLVLAACGKDTNQNSAEPQTAAKLEEVPAPGPGPCNCVPPVSPYERISLRFNQAILVHAQLDPYSNATTEVSVACRENALLAVKVEKREGKVLNRLTLDQGSSIALQKNSPTQPYTIVECQLKRTSFDRETPIPSGFATTNLTADFEIDKLKLDIRNRPAQTASFSCRPEIEQTQRDASAPGIAVNRITLLPTSRVVVAREKGHALLTCDYQI